MFRISCALLLVAQLIWAGDFLKKLSPDDLSPGTTEKRILMAPWAETATRTCAIPLQEVRIDKATKFDSITPPFPTHPPLPFGPTPQHVDDGMKHQTPIPVCPTR